MAESDLPSAVHFGAGNIGRGFIGLLLAQSGFRVVFVDAVESLVALINERKSYKVITVGEEGEKTITVEGISAIHVRDEKQIVDEISRAAILTTAVGPGALPAIAPLIARGLQRRAYLNVQLPLNIIACENVEGNSQLLRRFVVEHLPSTIQGYVEKFVGFPNCVVDRVVPGLDDTSKSAEPLSITVEEYFSFIVERRGLAGTPPSIKGMVLSDNLKADLERKLFTFNTAHAVAAYIGYRKGCKFIHEAMRDPEIRQVVSGSLDECSAMLIRRHNLAPEEQKQYAAKVLRRFECVALPDPVIRAGRDPKRKLAHDDRLIKPARLALEQGGSPSYLATGIAAAIYYDYPGDSQAAELSHNLKQKGLDKVLEEVCGLSPDSALAKLIKEKARRA